MSESLVRTTPGLFNVQVTEKEKMSKNGIYDQWFGVTRLDKIIIL